MTKEELIRKYKGIKEINKISIERYTARYNATFNEDEKNEIKYIIEYLKIENLTIDRFIKDLERD